MAALQGIGTHLLACLLFTIMQDHCMCNHTQIVDDAENDGMDRNGKQ